MKTVSSFRLTAVVAAALLFAGPYTALAQTTSTGNGAAAGSGAGTGAKPERVRGSEIDLPVGAPFDDLANAHDFVDPDESDGPKLYDEDLPTDTQSIIYVVDVSGSMRTGTSQYTGLDGNAESGSRLDRAKVELIRSISALTEDFYFNVVAYSCSVSQWRSARQQATPENKTDATGWIIALYASGGTGTGTATGVALADKENYTMALLSDGSPNCSSGISEHLATVSASNTQGATIHTFGIGAYGQFEQFLRDIAQSTGGTYFPID